MFDHTIDDTTFVDIAVKVNQTPLFTSTITATELKMDKFFSSKKQKIKLSCVRNDARVSNICMSLIYLQFETKNAI